MLVRYEAGAAVAHQENAYFVAFCELFGLKRRKIAMSSVGVDKFGMIYEQQRKGVAYESPQEMLQNLGTTTDNLAPMLDLSVDDYLTRECGIGEKLVKEVVNAGTRCNYRQPGRCLNAFCGTVSMAGTDVSSLFSVVGGNEQVPCKCLDESAARVVCDARVFKVEVLQTCPLESSGIDVVGSRNARKALGLLQTEGHSMCRTVSHFTKGKIRPSIVNSEGPISLAGVLTYEPDEDLPWTAIGCQIPVDATPEEAKEIVARLSRGEESVFKIFAERPLTEPEIDSLIERTLPSIYGDLPYQTLVIEKSQERGI
ncbi:hypothetical protein Pmar_PMAR011510 [Perkinsus marinus ATCC 50983]|uniref:Prenylcysteine lyase domain-containing protein n=1 Tax=Perkinsus marinus (strain ATCC 50983 / TXsc) TaxID=423536 RepID=C5LC03_PERM5|nr:hypothetical protein Pmar_PMAR011510 [Perkinsus marinus ATCC 50983]EER05486.1 hypothetical protein Pmar_PMAR011510 [Perkinsus marinus ATCC 50983]|eukprot:XP_002773670.1 hypothetical protein Pmar_PMAR011510 [Perkinsus marinus ATCC 50983]